jgi:hypothetical protein
MKLRPLVFLSFALVTILPVKDAGAQSSTNPPIWRYSLLEGSYLTSECLPCGGPIIQRPLRGRFDLVLVEENALFSRYALKDISFLVGSGPNVTYTVIGEGTYQTGGEVALRQEMTLYVSVNGSPLVFTNEDRAVTRTFPLVEVSLRQTQLVLNPFYSMHLVAAPVREIWFSTAGSFTGAKGINGGPGDLVSASGRIVRSNSTLVANLGFMPVVGHVPIDAVDIAPGAEVLFSLDRGVFSETLGPIQEGDLVSERGHIVQRNQRLLSAFGVATNAPDAGLDAVMVKDDGEVLFSIRTNLLSPLGVTLHRGDVLSSRGQVIKTFEQLLSRFRPQLMRDYGLDALYVWPHGEVWFSTEEGFADQIYGTILAGDLLSDQGIVVFRNLELLSAFAPIEDLADFGLDALFVITDVTPAATPPRFTRIAANQQTGDVLLEWMGQGRAFQLERSQMVTGPYGPISPIQLELLFNDKGALQAPATSFYRLRQW